jgi:proline dehydrogenase
MVRLMVEKGHRLDHPNLCASQLYGMSDHITFALAEVGVNVAKYLPYGTIESVLPYLFRRAQENTSIAGQTSRELELVRKEIQRRKQRGSTRKPVL